MTDFQHVTITIEHDSDCESPLEHDEGVFITYNKSSRYTLGNTPADSNEHAAIGKRIELSELIGLPVYAYIHGGIALSTGPFSCPWDSGQSGWIYITRETALAWYGGKILTAAKRVKALNSLRAIVAEYSSWLNGDCYGYIIEDMDGEEVDACWGFIGRENAEEQAACAATREEARIIESNRQAWRGALHEARERNYWAARDVVTC